MSDLEDLYQQVILDHYKNPRNFKKLPNANRTVEGYNPLCGDHYIFYVELDGDVVRDVSFEGSGCAISKASASLMTSTVKGKSVPEIEVLFDQFREMVTGQSQTKPPEELGRMAAFGGVAEHPSRIKCATLGWHSLSSAVHGEGETASTE